MKEAYTFDDVLIVPNFSDISSRKDVNTKVSTARSIFQDIGSRLPIISANMDTITESEMSKAMLSYGANACLHRFCNIQENVKMFEDACLEEGDSISRPMVSIGLGTRELDRASALYGYGATRFIIDVANGASLDVVKQVKELRNIIKDNGAIIVGNFASGRSISDFIERGAIVEGIKVGIGPGSSCSTRVKTGVGYPQLSAIMGAVRALKGTGIPIIADGGIKTAGDVAKAIGAGASLCMIGGMISGTDECPGEIIYDPPKQFADSKKYKKYRGSASKESYIDQGKTGSHRTDEGESFLVPCKGPVANILQDIEGGLRSAMSYVGARTIKEFQEKCEFVKITNAGYSEGLPHGKK